MILLIGPDNWSRRLKRELEDRTTHRRRVAIDEQQLRGTREWIETIVYVDTNMSWDPTPAQLHAMGVADALNVNFVNSFARKT
jgi:hypothetical protein